jgi:septum site-determining protein MinD
MIKFPLEFLKNFGYNLVGILYYSEARGLKVIVIASGKGGTGKTSFTAGVGLALAEIGKKVLVIDGDSGLRNLDIVLGLSDRLVFSFADVVEGIAPLKRAAVQQPDTPNLSLLTAPSSMPALRTAQMSVLRDQAEQMGFEYMLIDGPAGLAEELRLFCWIATQGVVITTPDYSSIRGAERVARLLEEENIGRVRMVVNRIRPKLIRFGMASNVDDAMDAAGLPLLGLVPEDEDIIACGNSGRSILKVKRNGSAQAFRNIARRLEGERLTLMRI